MTFDEFRREHRDLAQRLIDACFGCPVNAAALYHEVVFEEGVRRERARCACHLKLGQQAGPKGLALAHDAIREGAKVDEMDYLAVAANGFRGAMVHQSLTGGGARCGS